VGVALGEVSYRIEQRIASARARRRSAEARLERVAAMQTLVDAMRLGTREREEAFRQEQQQHRLCAQACSAVIAADNCDQMPRRCEANDPDGG